MLRYIMIFFTLMIWVSESESQNILDAYRYSFQTPTGSARYNGLSGAMSAIGADFSTVNHNPAGIAAFWKSEVAGTLGVSIIGNNSTLIDGGTGSIGSNEFKFIVPQGGIVFTTYTPNKSWMSKSFGITYNRLAGYGNEVFYEGNSRGSVSERWAALGSGLHPDELDFLEAGPAYDADVIYDFEGDYLYEYDYFLHENEKLQRSQLISTTGSMGELAFTFGGNYMNRFLIGGAIGIDFFNFQSEKAYEESDPEGNVPQFEQLRFNEYLSTDGAGFNAKIGTILRITPEISWSASMASPTVLSLKDNFRNTIQYTWNDGGKRTAEADSGESHFDYSFINPWRFSTGLGYRIGGRGFVNAEIDYVGYKSSKFKFKNPSISDRNYQNDLNRQLNSEFSNVLNFRLGGEMAVSAFRFRAGGSMYGSPYEDYKNTLGFSLGFGYRGDNWYLDLAYMNRGNSYHYAPYELLEAEIPSVDIKNRISDVGLTIGFKM